MPRLLRDQVVVITGASTGIGRAAALAFAARGARVVLAARNAEALETVAADIRAQGGQALVVPTDVTDMAAVERLAEAAVERFGRIDTWVNNAAVSFYATFEQATLAEMRRQMDVNYWGNVHGFKAALPHLRAGGGGVLISVASALSDFAIPLQGTYCAAKHALRALTESLRIELMHERAPIDVVLIKPPSVDTPFFQHARTKTGFVPKPVAPVYDPAVIARRIVMAAESPRREVLIGGAAQFFALVHRNAPRLFEWHQSKFGIQGQQTREPKPVEGRSNFYAPLDEPGAVRVDGHAWKASWVMWLEEHPKTTIAGAAAAAAAVALMRRGPSR
jgi:NAD(P)-dependent dehydrogenase (short-subunit alcohol dehydrogenase family)